MKQIFIFLIMAIFATSLVAATNPGSIWTTKNDCGDASQDVNHYAIGDVVYINGANFNPDTYSWDITGQPGGASCDPNIVVVSGNETVDANGNFCFAAYTVQNDDCGEYKAHFNNKQDNYRVDDDNQIPEFGVIGAALGATVAVAGFLILRKRN
jgi:hypothetical protein